MSSEKAIDKTMACEYESKNFEVYFQNLRDEMLQYIPQHASIILDVGCASGNFGQLLKTERSVEIWGIEPNEHAASIAGQKLDKVIHGAFTRSLNLPSQSFDCIIFNDVLEHLVDPYSALLYCKELLREGGVVVASIPNVRYFDNIWNLLVHKNWEYAEYGILDKTHLRFFTHRSILSTFDSLGYWIKSIEGINPLEKKHPHRVRKFKLINWLLFNKIEDMRYLQFAVVALPTTY